MNAFRFLVRSVIFLGLVCGLCVFLFPYLKGFALANPFLNGIILSAFGVGVGYIFWKLLKLAREMQLLRAFSVDFPDFSNALQDRMEKTCLLRTLFYALENRKTLTSSQEALISERIESALESDREVSRYLMGLLIFLGLLGTFWGLSQTIAALSHVISNLQTAQTSVPDFFEALKLSLKSPLGGMGTAFSTSFFGLASSLVLGFLDLQLGRASQFFLRVVEDEIKEFSAPALGQGIPVTGEPTLAYTQAFWQYLGEHLESLQKTVTKNQEMEQITQEALGILAEKLSKLTDQMRTEQTLMIKIGEGQLHLQHILRETVQEIATQGIPLDETTRAHLRNIDVVCEKLTKDLDKQHKELLADVKQEVRLLTQTMSHAIAFQQT
jgi:hypothetical protein